jgi:transmembrane sensor
MAQTIQDTQENPEWVLMAKALHGELSEEEQQRFSAWLNESESNARQWAQALEVWEQTGSEQNISFSPDLDQAWTTFCAKADFVAPVQISTQFPEASETEVRPLFAWNTLYKYAAALVLAAGLASLAYLQLNTSPEWVQVVTLSGERKLVYLPDSSQVTLNSNSTLRYQAAFAADERLVELTGEGFFEVKRNPAQPFVVQSGDAQTKVLGTSFNIRALANEPEVQVAVVTGKVGLSSLKTKKQVFLTPGYTGVVSAKGQIAKAETSPASAPAWRALAFKANTLAQVVVKLEEYFNVTIEVPNQKLQQCTFTGTFDHPELLEILQVVAATLDSKLIQNSARNFTLEGAGCQ